MLLSTSCVLLMTSLISVQSAMLASSPLERAMFDVIELQMADGQMDEGRNKRSATGGVPCVTVQYLAGLQDRFRDWFDHNNDGIADFAEIENYIRRFKPNVKKEMVAAFIRRRDMNGNGAIDFVPEYVQDLSAPDYTLEGATEWFGLQDSDDNGAVSEAELTNMAQAIGMSPEAALQTVRGYYMSHDQDKDGQLNFDEFKALYNQNR